MFRFLFSLGYFFMSVVGVLYFVCEYFIPEKSPLELLEEAFASLKRNLLPHDNITTIHEEDIEN